MDFKGSRCALCGRPVPYDYSFKCESCMSEDVKYFSAGLCVFPYSKVRKSVHILKYYGGSINAKPYARIMYDYFRKTNRLSLEDFDAVTFVPMHPEKERRRWYNQAKVIAEEFSRITGKPCETFLKKTVLSEAQSLKSKDERKTNVENTFSVVSPEGIKDKRILIIDDVLTTGSTINECAKALIDGGADRVMFMTFAYGGV